VHGGRRSRLKLRIKNVELRTRLLNSYFLIPNFKGLSGLALAAVPTLSVCRAESVAIALLVLRLRTEPSVVAGVGEPEPPLAFNIPPAIAVPILAPHGTSFGPPAFVPRHVGIRERTPVVAAAGTSHVSEFRARNPVVLISIERPEGRKRIVPFAGVITPSLLVS
jgi:hypothetical protein